MLICCSGIMMEPGAPLDLVDSRRYREKRANFLKLTRMGACRTATVVFMTHLDGLMLASTGSRRTMRLRFCISAVGNR
jgi:hypothetical protein